MLRTVSADVLISRCKLALGYTSGIPAGTELSMRLEDGANDAIRRVWTHAHWPMLRRIERRTYRPPYDFNLIFSVGQECWHDGFYWRALIDNPTAKPGTDASAWQQLESSEVTRFIALDQPWENTEIALGGIDLRGFAYARDPKQFPDQPAISGCSFSGDYPGGGTTRVLLPPTAPDVVWVAFIPNEPRISLTPWRANTVYAYGDTVHHGTESWVCLTDDVTSEPGTPDANGNTWPWRPVRVPEFMALCIVSLVRVDFIADDQGRAQSKAFADAELERLYETYFGCQGEGEDADFGWGD